MKKHAKRGKLLALAAAVLLALVGICLVYLNTYSRASPEALLYLSADAGDYAVEDTGEWIAFIPEDPIAGLVFYPGGKVEHTAYAPLMAALARRGVLAVLVRMPFRLAVFDPDAAAGIPQLYPQVSRWYAGGHSLGGAMAASCLSGHAREFEGLLLLGAYSTADLSGTALRVFSLYGTRDGVLRFPKYEANRANLPETLWELPIEGGCHSYFGDYGMQKGDGVPSISREEQLRITADYFVSGLLARS